MLIYVRDAITNTPFLLMNVNFVAKTDGHIDKISTDRTDITVHIATSSYLGSMTNKTWTLSKPISTVRFVEQK